MAFVHLHVHSQFSILDGTASVDELAARAAGLGMGALALTDTSNLYGAVAFYKACKSHGIKAILGAELHVQPDLRAVRTFSFEERFFRKLFFYDDRLVGAIMIGPPKGRKKLIEIMHRRQKIEAERARLLDPANLA